MNLSENVLKMSTVSLTQAQRRTARRQRLTAAATAEWSSWAFSIRQTQLQPTSQFQFCKTSSLPQVRALHRLRWTCKRSRVSLLISWVLTKIVWKILWLCFFCVDSVRPHTLLRTMDKIAVAAKYLRTLTVSLPTVFDYLVHRLANTQTYYVTYSVGMTVIGRSERRETATSNDIKPPCTTMCLWFTLTA